MDELESTENGSIPKIEDATNLPVKSCALCGCSTPAVRCDRCNSQIFCLSCDDMYHKHPKRRLHLRKAVDSIWSSARSPRLRRRTDLPGDPSKIPIPPPRSKKRERHTLGGRMFMKTGLELGSFGHSKMFDRKSLTPPPKDMYAKPKMSPNNSEDTYENEAAISAILNTNAQKKEDIYENDNVIDQDRSKVTSSGLDHSPWNSPQPTISPIQVSIPSSTPELVTNGQSFGFPSKPQSRSITDLSHAPMSPGGHHPYHYPHPYPYMHPPVQPPYSHSMAHLNCAQCLSSSWSNLMNSHPSPYFHPMPWGPPHATLDRSMTPDSHGQMKHSHGNLGAYPDPNVHFPYPGGVYYPNSMQAPDLNLMKDLHQQPSGSSKVRRSPSASSRSSRHAKSIEDLPTASDAIAESNANPNENTNESLVVKVKQDNTDEEPKAPVAPSKPWSCLHCTFINPPGIYICQVCCKTSYGNQSQSDTEDNRMDSPMDNRNSDSPMELVNMDAEIMQPEFSNRKAQKVI